MVRRLIRNQLPRKGLRVRVPCPPLQKSAAPQVLIPKPLRKCADSRTADLSELAEAIALRDRATVSRTPGVGPKVAERIVTELKDKVPKFTSLDPAVVQLSGALDEKRAPRPVMDAVSALVNLGYGQPQAAAAIAAASREAGEGADTATLIRQGLKELAR